VGSLVGGSQGTQVVGTSNHPFQRCHHCPAETALASIRTHRDTFHVSGTQRPTRVDQSPLHHGGMPDQVNAVPCQGMDATEGVLPVLIGHVVEDVIQKPSTCTKGGRIEIGGMGKRDVGRPNILACPGSRWATELPRSGCRGGGPVPHGEDDYEAEDLHRPRQAWQVPTASPRQMLFRLTEPTCCPSDWSSSSCRHIDTRRNS
jgi:hypothetical protein